jgi:hypothetical protein
VGRIEVDDAHPAMATVVRPGPAPGRTGPGQPRRTPEERLAELEQRYRQGKVPQREYLRIRGNVLAATAPPPRAEDARPFPAPPPARADLRTFADPPVGAITRALPGPPSTVWTVLPGAVPAPTLPAYPTLPPAPPRTAPDRAAATAVAPPRRGIEWYPILAAVAVIGLMALAFAIWGH